MLEQVLADDLLVGERAGGAADHALAAGDAGGVAHGLVGVEGDGGEVAFALAGDDVVVANFGAAADAAVAEDAGGVVDVDGERGVVVGHDRDGALAEADFVGARRRAAAWVSSSQSPDLLLAHAGRGVVREHQLVERFADCDDGLGVGVDDHAGLGLEDAGGLEGALADVAEADAADADGGLVLLMAERGDGDAGDARGVEDGGAVGDGDFMVVDGERSSGRVGGWIAGHACRSYALPRSRCRRGSCDLRDARA